MTTITHDEILQEIRDLVAREGSQVVVATDLEMTPQYLNDILHGRKLVSDTVARQLGYERIVSYKKVGEE